MTCDIPTPKGAIFTRKTGFLRSLTSVLGVARRVPALGPLDEAQRLVVASGVGLLPAAGRTTGIGCSANGRGEAGCSAASRRRNGPNTFNCHSNTRHSNTPVF
jgi:hypothetical protein